MYLRKLNSEASDTNVLQLTEGNSGCCPETLVPCKFSLIVDAIEDVDTLTFIDKDGNEATVAVGFLGSEDAGDLKTKLDEAMRRAGFVDDGKLPNINIFFTDVPEPSMVIEIFTSGELVDLITESGTTEFDRSCTETTLCCYKFSVTPADAFSAALDDVDLEDEQEIDGDFGDMEADEEDFTTEVEAELGNLYGADYSRIHVHVNNETTQYDVTFWLYGRHKPTLDGDRIALCGCVRDYVE